MVFFEQGLVLAKPRREANPQSPIRNPKSNDAGFTLIELMVVVLIIGVIVAIAIPTYEGAQVKSRDAACKHNLRTVDGAIATYRAANPDDQLLMNWGELVPIYLKQQPDCPAGGAYSFGLDDRLHCSLADPGPPPKHSYY